ncbi:MAG: Hpt domain-containing protein, partial [Acidobacteriota bacterium]|nr:Hpt domain-containing protein [Acidobacteriota bacterium]
MNGPDPAAVELFLQEASEHLQYLREYSGMLQEPQTTHEDLEKLYIAAHTLAGTSASYGFPQFSEVAAKMAHIFHYATNATLSPEMYGPLTEFISDAISVLEFDLLQISSSGIETAADIAIFKQRYAFAFPAAPSEIAEGEPAAASSDAKSAAEATTEFSLLQNLPQDGEVPDDVLEF